jgi:hypothetical protein
MTHLISIFLFFHVVFGYLSLSCGTIIMFLKKGNSLHKRLGLLFYWSLWGVVVSSTVISIWKKIPFLFFMGNFVLYQNYSGHRVLKNKLQIPNFWDYLVLVFASVNGIAMIYTLNLVLVFFGALTLFLVFTDIQTILKVKRDLSIQPKAWLSKHLGMMMGAYIETLTAFIVVNVHDFSPAWLLWLAPTFILVPLMRYWNWKFTRNT